MTTYDWRSGLSLVRKNKEDVVVMLRIEGTPPTTFGELDWWTPYTTPGLLPYPAVRRMKPWHGLKGPTRGIRNDLKNYILYFFLPMAVWDAIKLPEDNELGPVAL